MKKVMKKGPSEMKAAGAHGPKHKAIKGPSAMKDAGGMKDMKQKHEADMMKGEGYRHLKSHMPGMKDGHNKLEKVPAESIGGKKYGGGKMAKTGGGDGNESED